MSSSTIMASAERNSTVIIARLSFVLSWLAFTLTHVMTIIWLTFITNDPLNFREGAGKFGFLFNTMDVDQVDIIDITSSINNKDDGSSSRFNNILLVVDYNAIRYNLFVFIFIWWIPHSGLSRNVVKYAIGLGPHHPLDRPIFSCLAPFCWWTTIYLWKPISLSSRWNIYETSKWQYLWRIPLVLIFLIEALGVFYLLPGHFFGTDRHTWTTTTTNAPTTTTKLKLIIDFPYDLVRHPAASFFLWTYWIAIPSYNMNHLFLAVMWTIFIVIGTLVFEERGLKNHEFKEEYQQYSQKVNAFIPSLWSIKKQFGLLRKEEKNEVYNKAD